MPDYIIDGAILTDIADAVREKTGKTEEIVPEELASTLLNSEGDYERGYAEGYAEGYGTGWDDGSISFDAYVEGRSFAVTGNATTVPESKFYNSKSVTAVILPKVRSIGASAFRGCENLELVDLSASPSLATSAFRACPKLYTLILRADRVQPLTNTNILQDTPIEAGGGEIYVPDNLVEQYKAANNWSDYASQIKPLSELEG